MNIHFYESITKGYLNNFIHSFWKYENSGESTSNHVVFPDGYFTLLVIYTAGNLSSIVLQGIYTKRTYITIPKSGVIFGVRFKVPAAEYVFKFTYKPKLNQSQLLPLTFRDINKIGDREFNKFVEQTTCNINQIIEESQRINEKKLKLFNLIYQNKTKTIKELAKETNWSTRQINRYFSANFEFTVKELMKIIRFRYNIKHISQSNFYPKNQYYDQSHFIKEVKKYAGTTPSILLKNQNMEFIQLLA